MKTSFLLTMAIAVLSVLNIPLTVLRAATSSDVAPVGFNVQLDTLHTGFDKETCWVHPRAGILPGQTPSVVLLMQKLLLKGSDVFYALNEMRTDDLGKTWTSPMEHGGTLGRRNEPDGDVMAVCDFTHTWHARSGTLLGIGQTVRYTGHKSSTNGTRETAYSTYDQTRHIWTPWVTLAMPDQAKFRNAGAGSVQRFDMPNGDILLPIYFLNADKKTYTTTVLRCEFNGKELSFCEQGNEFTINSGRGLCEPSITFYQGRYFLTLRNDQTGYVTRGQDGLHFDPPRPWLWDDGTDLGNYNTQQHWVTHSGGLFLVYTRRGANNDHVFRHRAPLFIAQVNPDTLRVIRQTERVLVPERGARLGNFGVTQVSERETWVTVAEWMQTNPPNPYDYTIPMRYGSDNAVFAARIIWDKPNRDADVVAGSPPRDCLASACDHRYGATATWSQTTDMAMTNSMFYAEACGFKFNMALTVFDTPFSTSAACVPMAQRQATAGTGRLSFQIYFQTDRWRAPSVADSENNILLKYPLIPDYYATCWTAAGAAAGFKVIPGHAKRTRTPNHGQEMFDLSNGGYGFNLANSQKGSQDVLSELIEVHCEWVKNTFGHYPSAGSYRNGQVGAAGSMSPYFLGLRNSAATGDLRYGTSPEGHAFLGSSESFTPAEAQSMAATTRAGDMDLPRDQVLGHCTGLLRKAIQTRGWYRDFIHWHTVPRFQTTLYDLLAAQRTEINGADVVTLNYGEALEHKFLRDMARVSATKEKDGIAVRVTYKDPYGGLPLRAIQIPLSVKVDLTGTALEGREIACPEACGVRKLSDSQIVVDVPFRQREETVTVHLREAVGASVLLDFRLPAVVSVERTGQQLQVRTDQPTRLALFTLPAGLALASVCPAGTQPTATVRLVGRDNTLTNHHVMDLAIAASERMTNDLYIGVISKERQSILWGPKRFSEVRCNLNKPAF